MIKLYLDFDGVILNTIDVTYEDMKKNNIVTKEEVREYYKYLDWDILINEKSKEINNSIDNIKELINSNLFDISILTHVISKEEGIAKKKFINNKLGNIIKVIPVDKTINKCDAVNPKNAILVDDYIINLDLWYKKGGIPIKFSDNNKKYKYITIKTLLEVLDYYEYIKEQIK